MPVPAFGKNGIVDLKLDDDQAIDLDHRRDRAARGADHRQRRDRHRRRAPAGQHAEEPPNTRRATSAASTCGPASACGSSTPFRSAASSATRRGRTTRATYTGNAGVWAQMTVDEELGLVYLPVELPTGDYYGGHRPGNNLFAREPGRARSEDRQAQVALPARPPRHLGLRHPVRADPRRHHRQRQADQGGRAADQAGLALRVRSRHRRAGVADRRAAGREGRRARRVVRADAAVPDQAAGVRSPGRVDRRPDRLHARAARRSRRSSCRSYKIGPLFTPPVVSKWDGRSAR